MIPGIPTRGILVGERHSRATRTKIFIGARTMQSIQVNDSAPQIGVPMTFEQLPLELQISDPSAVRYLSQFEEPTRSERAIEALRVGVIAIQSASPTLDTRIVDVRFRELSRELEEFVGDFRDELTEQMATYFDGGTGSVPKRLDSLLGTNGSVSGIFSDYFSPDDGKLAQLLLAEIGPASKFARSLDPNNREGVISRIESTVNKNLDQRIGTLVEEFSLDKENSAMDRLRKSVTDEIRGIQTQVSTLFAQLRESLGVEAGREQESLKGTEKGREFEVALYDVAEIGRSIGDPTENVRGLVGDIERCKKGDYVLTLGETSGAPGLRIVVEAKKNNACKLRGALEELEEAKRNRNAVSGIFVFADGYQPPEVGDFLRIGNDFFVTVTEKAVLGEESPIYLEAAYKIARAIVITSARKKEAEELDLDMLSSDIDTIIQQVSRLSDFVTKARTIRTNSTWIEEQAGDLQERVVSRLSQMTERIREVAR
jgi:hypothetical protein